MTREQKVLRRKTVYEDSAGFFEAYIFPKSKNNIRIEFAGSDYPISMTKEELGDMILALIELHEKMKDAEEDEE